MTLEAVSDTKKIALGADWVELQALLSPRGSASDADLARSRAALEEYDRELIENEFESEDLEEEILDSQGEAWTGDIREELANRVAALGDSYPYAFAGTGHRWNLYYRGDVSRHDHLLYVCCLLVTAERFNLTNLKLRDLDKVLQIISYLVAARIVQGSAYWFGYPRPDGTSMGQAVTEVLTRMGFESPILAPPLWSVGTENDGGVDIVAWRNFGDALPGRVILYGQVASGKNWDGKSVTEYTQTTFPYWLGDYGQRWYLPAMFIPWPQYVEVYATRDRSFRQRVIESSIKGEKTFGITVDRGRIAELATERTSTGNGDEEELIAFLEEWMRKALNASTG